MKELTHKEEIFVLKYIKYSNAARAYQEAYPARDGSLHPHQKCRQWGYNKIKKPEIARAIENYQEELRERAKISATEALLQAKRIASSDIRDLFDKDGKPLSPNNLPEHVAPTLKSLKVEEKHTQNGDVIVTCKYEFWDKHKALDRLYRYLNMGPDHVQRNEHTGKRDSPIKENIEHSIPDEALEIIKKITGRDLSGDDNSKNM